MRHLLAVAALLSLPHPLSWRVVVNGQTLRDPAVLVRGRTYIPLDALQDLGVSVTVTEWEVWLGSAAPPLGREALPAPPPR